MFSVKDYMTFVTKHTAWIGLFFSTLMLSCASSNVVQYLSDEAQFGSYHTYKVINYKTDNKEYSAEGNAFIDSVELYIHQQMLQRDYTTDRKTDLLVRYELISGVETNISYNNNNSGYYRRNVRGLYSPFYDPYYIGPTSSRHIEGILLLEIKESKTRKLVWQGSLDLKYSKRKEDGNLEMIKDAIREIFLTYPYIAGNAEPVVPEGKKKK